MVEPNEESLSVGTMNFKNFVIRIVQFSVLESAIT